MDFSIEKYVGKWYEVARINNEFEPNMTNVMAFYSLKEDGTVKVVNSGVINNELKEIIGIAITTDVSNLLKVSFYKDNYSDYKVLFIDENYQYSLVGGSNKNFLWILSRNKSITRDIYNKLLNIAIENGYNINNIVESGNIL